MLETKKKLQVPLGVRIYHEQVYLKGFGDSGFGSLVDLSLSNTPAAALPQLTQTEAQILLIRIVFNLQHRDIRLPAKLISVLARHANKRVRLKLVNVSVH